MIRRGSCSGATDWKLKLSPEDGKIEVEYEVDSNRRGQTWAVRIVKNGNVIFRGNRTTSGPSGSFEVRVVTSNPAGSDVFRARATHAGTDLQGRRDLLIAQGSIASPQVSTGPGAEPGGCAHRPPAFLDQPAERLESLVPRGADRAHPRFRLGERRGAQGETALSAASLARCEAREREFGEVLRGRLTRDADPRCEAPWR